MKQGCLYTGQGRQQGSKEAIKVKLSELHIPIRDTMQVRELVLLGRESTGNSRWLVWVLDTLLSSFSHAIQTLFKEQLKEKSCESRVRFPRCQDYCRGCLVEND